MTLGCPTQTPKVWATKPHAEREGDTWLWVHGAPQQHLRRTKDTKVVHTHTKGNLFSLWKKAKKRKVCIFSAAVCTCSRGNISMETHYCCVSCSHQSRAAICEHCCRAPLISSHYVPISSLVCLFRPSPLPEPPSTCRSPQRDERPAKLRRSCREGRHHRAQLTAGHRSLRVL